MRIRTYIRRWGWYYQFGGVLLVLVIVYFITHNASPGEEMIKFSGQDIVNIQSIINSVEFREDSGTMNPGRPGGATTRGESLQGNDTTKAEPADKKNEINRCGWRFSDAPPVSRRDSISYFIDSYIRAKYDITDTCRYVAFLAQFHQVNFHISFLNGYNLKVKSYFWLTESKVFFEIIFWTLFGVICNLLYHVSEALRSNQFNRNENYVHWAKLIYSPIISIVIYFSIESLIADGQISLNNLRHGLVVLSFILGFFSGRTIELLNKLKDLLLPLGKTTDASSPRVFDMEGVVQFDPAIAQNLSDNLANVAIKLFSLNDPTVSDITNPLTDGTFFFKDLPAGDYTIQAEIKIGEDVYEGQTTLVIPVPEPDTTVKVLLQKTN